MDAKFNLGIKARALSAQCVKCQRLGECGEEKRLLVRGDSLNCDNFLTRAESKPPQGNSMLSTEKATILDICKRFGDHELMKFIRETETDEIVDMLEKNGDGDALVDWFKEAYPEQFHTESADERAYWDNADFRHDSAQEERILKNAKAC